jgi:hypothetical protein
MKLFDSAMHVWLIFIFCDFNVPRLNFWAVIVWGRQVRTDRYNSIFRYLQKPELLTCAMPGMDFYHEEVSNEQTYISAKQS